MTTHVEHQIADRLRTAGARGWVHARPVSAADPAEPGRQAVDVGADHPVPMASLYKLPLAVAWARLVADGHLDPHEPVRVSASDHTPGPTGLSALRDPVILSQRDVVTLMLTLSDNTAADVILGRVGLSAVNQVLADAGMSDSVVHGGTRHHQRLLLEETGAPGFPEALRLLAQRPGHDATAIYDPALSSVTTARDLTKVLVALWRNDLVEPAWGAFVRGCLARQVFRHRLASGFPHDDVEVANRTGTLLALRHDVGVVTFPGEEPIAVAVLTQALNPAQHLPSVDAAIGSVGGLAVRALRRLPFTR